MVRVERCRSGPPQSRAQRNVLYVPILLCFLFFTCERTTDTVRVFVYIIDKLVLNVAARKTYKTVNNFKADFYFTFYIIILRTSENTFRCSFLCVGRSDESSAAGGYPDSPIVLSVARGGGNTGPCAVTPQHRPTPVCHKRRCPCVIFPTRMARAAVYFPI